MQPSRALLPFLLVLLVSAARSAEAGIDRWTPIGPDGGTIMALAADPQIHGTLYAGTKGGAIWKSLDGGAHWFAAHQSPLSFDVSALAVAPGGSGRVWAGTPGGIFQTDDGGATWQRVWSLPGRPDGALDQWVTSLAADPTDPEVAWAGTWAGEVLKTTNGGATWDPFRDTDGRVNGLAIDPTDPDTVYTAGIFGTDRTTDGGLTWTRLRDEEAVTLLIDPIDPRILYLNNFFEIWKSTDAGATWNQLVLEGNILGLFLDPDRPSVLLAGISGGALMRSEDAGATWQKVDGLPYLLTFTFAANPSGLWLGVNNRGVFQSLDDGGTWRATNRGLSGSHVLDIELDPFRPRTLYTVAEGTGFHRSVNGGATWRRSNTGLLAVGGSAILLDDVEPSPVVPGLLLAGSEGGLFLSRDRGAHWRPRLTSGATRSITFSPRLPNEIFAGGDSLFRSRDGGNSWQRLRRPDTSYDSEIAEILVSPVHPRLVYFFDINERRGTAQSLFRSLDRGDNWRRVFDQGPTALDFHPTLAGVQVLATQNGEIWKTADRGTTWEKIADAAGDGRKITDLLFDRIDPSILYLATDGAGVRRSLDGGLTWAPLATGMIAPRIVTLESDPRSPRRLLAGTQGGGVLEIRLTTP